MPIVHSDARAFLSDLPDSSVDTIVTSPPYWGLRDYNVNGQIGREASVSEYIAALVAVFSEAHRVLKPTGSLWVNIGDKYSTHRSGQTAAPFAKSGILYSSRKTAVAARTASASRPAYRDMEATQHNYNTSAVPEKGLMLIPERLCIALADAGWVLRQRVIWAKPSPMPESVKDRLTQAFETIFHFVKDPERYWYDRRPLMTPVKQASVQRQKHAAGNNRKYSGGAPGQRPHSMHVARAGGQPLDETDSTSDMANGRNVWVIPADRNDHAHYAAFPMQLALNCIRLTTPPGGVVCDPFMGSGTVAVAAQRGGYSYTGCDLNLEYVELANERVSADVAPHEMPASGPFQIPLFVE